MSAPTLIDPVTIKTLRALNSGEDDFLKEIVGLFSADLPARIAELEESLAARDALKFRRAAHSIKGSAANLGAVALRACAERLENQAQDFGLTGVQPLIDELKAEGDRAQAALQEILASPPAN